MLNDNEEGTTYVLYEIEKEYLTLGRVTVEDFQFPSVPPALSPIKGHPLRRSPQQFLEMASESTALFNDGQENIFDDVLSAVTPGISRDRLDVKSLPQFVRDRLF